jgi:hypothetical protein
VESKSIRKERLIAAIEVAAWDSGGVEKKPRVWKARSNELSIDSRIIR